MTVKRYGTYTFTLPVEVMERINDHAKQNKVSKDKIIEAVLVRFIEEEKRNAYGEGFKRVALDKKMRDIAEEGMKDYSEQLKNYQVL